MTASADRDDTRSLRWALLAIAAFSTAGIAAELAFERHWETFVQRIPWMCIAALCIALTALVVRPRRLSIGISRLLAISVIGASAYGVYEHVRANHDTAPLDFRYTETWSSLSATTRWWKAFSGDAGPAPTLAAGVMAQSALCILAATIRHPALRESPGNG